MKVSARNVLKGKIVKINPGAVNTEITLQLKGGDHIVSVITNDSVKRLRLKEKMGAYAIIKASSVMIGVK